MMPALIAGLLAGVTATVQADGPLKTGKDVYDAVCVVCHGAQSAVQAPRFNDRKAWAPLIAEGQHVLTAHAWVGVRAMPPRGGDERLTLEEFGRAVAYIARSAGASWRDPDRDEKLMAKIRSEEAKRRLELKPN